MTASLRSFDNESVQGYIGLKAVESPSSRFPLHLVTPQGQIQIHTASYRGSFSIVLSEALRAAGLGSRVLIAQFLKGGVNQGPDSGIKLCRKLNWIRPDLPFSIANVKKESLIQDEPALHKGIGEIWQFCKEQLSNKKVDRLVLDEIGLACSYGFINKTDLITTLTERPTSTDIILTGPSISSEVIEMADQFTKLR